MEFNEVLNFRTNTYKWDDKIPALELIDQIVNGVHCHVPSKQRRVRYDMRIIPAHSMSELQHKMYAGCKADADHPKSRYNPQVLAPFVIAFAPRPAGNDGVAAGYYEHESDVEIGMAAMYVALAAVDVGLAVGFCACIRNRKEMVNDLGIAPHLYLGVGYPAAGNQYYCPVYQTLVDIPDSDSQTKPPMNEYVKYV
jgi:hypothetical protein